MIDVELYKPETAEMVPLFVSPPPLYLSDTRRCAHICEQKVSRNCWVRKNQGSLWFRGPESTPNPSGSVNLPKPPDLLVGVDESAAEYHSPVMTSPPHMARGIPSIYRLESAQPALTVEVWAMVPLCPRPRALCSSLLCSPLVHFSHL